MRASASTPLELTVDRAFAALTLTGVPAYVGMAIDALPFIGWLLMLLSAIVSLYCSELQ